MDVATRAKEGLFLAFQYPLEIPGLSNLEFLKSAFNSINKHQGAKPMEDKQLEKLAFKKS